MAGDGEATAVDGVGDLEGGGLDLGDGGSDAGDAGVGARAADGDGVGPSAQAASVTTALQARNARRETDAGGTAVARGRGSVMSSPGSVAPGYDAPMSSTDVDLVTPA